MVTIVLRVFPSGRRGSFSSIELKINKDRVFIADVFSASTQVSPTTHKLARGISFLKATDELGDNEIINAIPL